MAVTNYIKTLLVMLAIAGYCDVYAVVLPEERADVLYHKYDGGGITIDGPSVLIRKDIGNSVSVSGNYYVDSISGASIDVMTQASEYDEERTQYSAGIDYLYDRSIMSYSYTSSSENDFEAETNSFNISQEIFGGLTTVSMGFSVGNNIVGKSTDTTFRRNSSTKDYRISLSQVLTKNMIMGLTYEAITDEGFLNNPYRQVRYIDPGDATNTLLEDEVYPETRSSNAAAIHLRYYLPNRTAIYGGYRFYKDTWDIEANTFDIGYIHTVNNKWLIDVNYRQYSQTEASFYKDLFPSSNSQTFQASDKELSKFSDYTIGVGATYEIGRDNILFFDKGSLNIYLDYISFDYENFLDKRVNVTNPGTEPGYSFSATVLRLYFSLWY